MDIDRAKGRRRVARVLGIKRQSQKHGMSPGSLIHVGEKKLEEARLRLIDYDDKQLTERELESVEECEPLKDLPTVTWINVDGLHDTDVIQQVGTLFDIHPLVLEDVLNTAQRPKLEDFGSYFLLVGKMLSWDEAKKEVRTEQLSLLVGPNWVVSFQERVGDVFEPLRKRIREHRGRVRRMGPTYLAFSLLDAVVDNYFTILERIGEELEPLEEKVLKDPDTASVQVLHKWKREALILRRAVAPLREVASALARDEHSLVPPETAPFLRDLHDHTLQVADTVDGIREMISSLLDLHHGLEPDERGDEGPHRHRHDLHPPDLRRRDLRHELRAHAGAGLVLGISRWLLERDRGRRCRAALVLQEEALAVAVPTTGPCRGRRIRPSAPGGRRRPGAVGGGGSGSRRRSG
jgi:magnesium transporter